MSIRDAMPHRQPWRRPAFAAAVLLLAWMPSLFYLGHWSALAAPYQTAATATNHLPGTDQHADHARHCHGASSCADQGGAATAVALRAEGAALEVTPPPAHAAARTSTVPIAALPASGPASPPPRTIA